MNKFTFDDVVRIKNDAPSDVRPGQKAWIVMVFMPQDRAGSYYNKFPPGVVYSVEYEDGTSIDVHEVFLESEKRT